MILRGIFCAVVLECLSCLRVCVWGMLCKCVVCCISLSLSLFAGFCHACDVGCATRGRGHGSVVGGVGHPFRRRPFFAMCSIGGLLALTGRKVWPGVETWNDGSRYKVEFSRGQKHGVGTYEARTGMNFHGHFRENQMDGHGIYKFPDGRSYEGQWRESQMNGKGRVEWANGSYCEGEYQMSLKHSTGTFR